MKHILTLCAVCFILMLTGAEKTVQSDQDALNRYLTKPAIRQRTAEPLVMHGFMSQMHRAAHPFYEKYFDGKSMPTADFLELRGPITMPQLPVSEKDTEMLRKEDGIFSFWKKYSELDYAMNAVAHTKYVPRFQISLIHSQDSIPGCNVLDFFPKKFGKLPQQMVDSNGGTTASLEKHRRCNFSRFDPLLRNFMKEITEETVKKYHGKNRIFCWHFRFPNENDWYVPISTNNFYDYSEPTRKAFRDFLKEKYGSAEKMNAAWNSTYSGFDKVTPPIPKFNRLNLDQDWQDWQEFRVLDVYQAQKMFIDIVRRYDEKSRIITWMTTGIKTASRDQILLDDAIKISLTNHNVLPALTWIDYYDFNGELYGQLAEAYGAKIAVEPGRKTPESYFRSFFNCMRFPVRQINWLFWIAAKPAPQLCWVLNQRALLDEVAAASLVQEPVAVLFSYSDFLMTVPKWMWGNNLDKNQISLFRAEARENLNFAMFSDYSDQVDLSRYQAIILPDLSVIRPQMIEKLAAFVKNGGSLFLLGEDCAAWNMKTGKKDAPLLTALGISGKPQSGTISAGKGKVVWRDSVKQLVDQKYHFTEKGKAFLKELPLKRPIRIDSHEVGSFIKKKDDIRYIGVINLGKAGQSVSISLHEDGKQITDLTELVSGEKVPVSGNCWKTDFDFAWQIKVFKAAVR